MRSTVASLLLLFSLTCSGLSDPILASGKKAVGSKPAKARAAQRLTAREAVLLVANRPEVKTWRKAVLAARAKGVTAHIQYDRKEGNDYIIHVYELVPDDAETSHTATMNWYHVNSRSGAVTKEF